MPVYSKLMDVQSSPQYEITYVSQFFAGYVLCTITVAVFSIITILVTHACGQLQIVMDICHNLLTDYEYESKIGRIPNELEFRRKLKTVVERHVRVLR